MTRESSINNNWHQEEYKAPWIVRPTFTCEDNWISDDNVRNNSRRRCMYRRARGMLLRRWFRTGWIIARERKYRSVYLLETTISWLVEVASDFSTESKTYLFYLHFEYSSMLQLGDGHMRNTKCLSGGSSYIINNGNWLLNLSRRGLLSKCEHMHRSTSKNLWNKPKMTGHR